MKEGAPHFILAAHSCAGCPAGMKLHTGCFADGDIKIVKTTKIDELKETIQKGSSELPTKEG